jgi:O-antigen/teichoic acid export membrane protein
MSGLVTKVLMAVTLLLIGLSGLGIMIAVTLSALVITLGSILLVVSRLRIKRPSIEKTFFVLKLGLSNYPATLTTLFVSGGIVLLGILTRDPAQVGSFYIAVMASMAAGSFASGIAMATLPALTKNDSPSLKDEALRLALALTVPLALPLAAYPKQLLALLGASYLQGASPLFVLSWGTLPTAALSIAFARTNSRRDLKKVAVASIAQLGSLILLITIMIGMGTAGAALAYLASTLISLLVIAEVKELILMFKSVAILVASYLASIPLTGVNWVLGLAALEVFAITLLLATKSSKVADLKLILSSIRR